MPHTTVKVFAQPLIFREIAARQNATIGDLARALGVRERQLHNYLTGAVSPNPRTRARICQQLALPFEALFVVVCDGEATDAQ